MKKNDMLEEYCVFLEILLKDNSMSADQISSALYGEYDLQGKTSKELTKITADVVGSLQRGGKIRFDLNSHKWVWL